MSPSVNPCKGELESGGMIHIEGPVVTDHNDLYGFEI
jgi:hypothetical protein